MSIQAGSIVAFEMQDDLPKDESAPQTIKRYGQVFCLLEGDLSLVVTPDGCSYIVYAWGLHVPGERDVFGRVFWPDWKDGEDINSDPNYVRGSTNELLRKPAMRRILARIINNRDRYVKGSKNKNDSVDEAWEIPTVMAVNHGGYNELSGYFLAYLDRPAEDRKTEETALRILKEGRSRRGSEAQYEVLLACYYGKLPMSWLADVWGVNRSVVHKQYHKAIQFLSLYAPVDMDRNRKVRESRSYKDLLAS